jgi:hypothetical protein
MATLFKEQIQILDYLQDDKTNELLVGGGAGGSKSFMLSFWLLKVALKYPGSRTLMGRYELTQLKKTTLMTFLEVCKIQGVEINKHFSINWQTSTINFANESTIFLMDLAHKPSDPEYTRLGSLELTAAAIDEAAEVTQRCKGIVYSRIRYKLDEFRLIPKLYMSCNPHKGWLYRDFYKPYVEGRLPAYRAYVPVLARHNRFISKHYAESLSRLDDVDRERLLEGNWEYDSDPARLIEYNKIVDVFTNDHVPKGDKFITADIAMQGSDLFVIFVWSGWRVEKILTFEKSTGKEVEDAIKDAAREYKVPRSNIVFDADGLGSYLGSYLEGANPFHNGAAALPRGNEDYKENYANLKTQCYFELAKRIQSSQLYVDAGNDGDLKDRLSEELNQVKRDRLDKDGKLFLLSKEQVKKNIGRSPDLSDAAAMRVWFDLTREKNITPEAEASFDNLLGHNLKYMGEPDYHDTDGY